MLFRGANGIEHLHGAYIDSNNLNNELMWLRYSHWSETRQSKSNKTRFLKKIFPRGIHGFTITEADINRKEKEVRAKLIIPSLQQSAKADSERIFASVLVWTMGQEEISCNMISEAFRVGWRRANDFIMRLHELGIVGELDAKLPRKVLIHSVMDAPPEVVKLLQKCGIMKDMEGY